MVQTPTQPDIEYPLPDGSPMAESDPAREYLIYGVKSLQIYFQEREDVYVSGNLEIFYKQGVPSAKVAPDVFVVFGVADRDRTSYKIWEEGGKVPSFVLEVTSKSTQENDEEDKPQKYLKLGVQEYFQFDPTGDYLNPPLKGRQLIDGIYRTVASTLVADGTLSLHSEVLGLDLQLFEGQLRFYNPETGERLLSHEEERQRAEKAEAEIARLKALLAQQGINSESTSEG
ncbi:MAG: Uma2 family endonuclease [Cyanobacteriota bacterium]|nr:Uma2 family endonuclease [Cyanobacteriota bacterium]